MKFRRLKQFVIIALIFIMTFSTYGGSVLANPSDIAGHWAEKQIKQSKEKGFVKGFPDGKFRPDAKITRAEFIALVNRKFKYSGKSNLKFPDVKAKEWYANEISAALSAGYIGGFEDGTMRPNAEISRQEVAAILTRILKLEKNEKAAEVFKDSIPTWSKGSVGAVAKNHLMVGMPDGKFGPAKLITRAESIVTLERIPDPKVTYSKAGVYGPTSGFETITDNVEITADGVTLQNLVIAGNLHITKAVGEGDVILKNVTVKGTTTVNGGGENSIHAENSTLNKVVVDKDNDKVRLVISGTSSISETTLLSGAKLEEKDVTKDGFGSIIVNAPKGSHIVLNGKFNSVSVNSADVTVEVASGSSVETLNVNQKAMVSGNGTIKQANVNADGVELKITPAKVNVKDGVKYPGTTTPGSGGGGGGTVISPPPSSGGGDNENPPSGVTIERIEDIVKNAAIGEDIQLPSTVKAFMSDGTEVNKNIIWNGKAYTGDVGTFEYEGAVEGYNRAVKYTLDVALTGYEESTDGTVATVSTAAALAHAQDVITIEEVVITKDLTLPTGFDLPIIINHSNVLVDLNNNSLETITVNADNVTLKNGTLHNINYGTNAKEINLENIEDLVSSVHELLTVETLNIVGNTNLKGEVLLKRAGSISITGDSTSNISGIVRIENIGPYTLTATIDTVIVEAGGAVINLNSNVDNMFVSENATISLGNEASITNPEKRTGITVNVVDAASNQRASFRAQSTINFVEALYTADLERYIHIAENFIDAADPGDLDGQFPQDAIDDLTDSKTYANSQLVTIKGDTDAVLASKQTAIDSEVSTLKTSLLTFSNARIFLDTSSLRNKIRAMEQLLARTTIGTTHGHVPQDAYNDLSEAVQAAKTALQEGLNESEVQEETEKLEDAHIAFQEAYIDLPFFDPESSTIQGSISFTLPEVDAGETFTDFPEFKVLNEEDGSYDTTGWSIHTGNRDSDWTMMEVTRLNHSSIDLNTVDKVYYTIASNKHIYRGTFTVADFKNQGELTLTPSANEVTGTLDINVDAIVGTLNSAHLLVTRTDTGLDQKWTHNYEVRETTNLPVGTYDIEYYGYDNNSEYILKKTQVIVTTGVKSVVFGVSEMDNLSIDYEDFTGWNLKAFDYQALNSNLRYFMHYLDEDTRTLHDSIKMTSNYRGLKVRYYAEHPERAGEQWNYEVEISRKNSGEDEAIITSPHFEFSMNEPQQGTVLNPQASFGDNFDIKIVNDYGHVLTQLSFYHDYSYLNYGGKITVKDISSGEEATRTLESIWEMKFRSIKDILPSATGDIKITFAMEESPFLIPTKELNVKVSE